MSESITIVFSAKDIDLSAISFMYKGEEIHLPFSASEVCKPVNQILSGDDEEVPELVRVRAFMTKGGASPGYYTPVSQRATPAVSSPLSNWENVAPAGGSSTGPQDATATYRAPRVEQEHATTTPSASSTPQQQTTLLEPVPLDDWIRRHPLTPSTTAKERTPRTSRTAAVNQGLTTPAVPPGPLVDEKFTIPASLPRPAPTNTHYTLPTITQQVSSANIFQKVPSANIFQEVPSANIFQNSRQIKTSPPAPTPFKINPSIWKEELACSSLQKKTFDHRSFVKVDEDGKTAKERKEILAKIYERLGQGEGEGFWECIPKECHEKPRPVPEGCGKVFLEQVLRSVVRSKREGF